MGGRDRWLRARLPLADSGERAAFSPDGSTLYTAGADASLRQWDLDGSRRFLAQVAPPPPFGWDETVAVAPGGGHVAYQTNEGVIFLDVRTGKLGGRLERPSGSTGLWGVWDPDGHRYALPTGDQVTVWDPGTGDVVQERPAGSEVTGIDFSTDGSRLAIAEVSGAVTMVDPATLEPLGAPVRLDDVPCAVSLGPDNRTAFVATGPPKAAWEFWRVPCSEWALVDLESGSLLDRGTTDLEGDIRRIDFSPGGDRVAVEVSGSLVELDLETGQPVRRPVDVHDGAVLSLAYSPDGSRILTSRQTRARRCGTRTPADSSPGSSPHRSSRSRSSSPTDGRCSSQTRTKERSTAGTPARTTPSSSPAVSRDGTSRTPNGPSSSATARSRRPAPPDTSARSPLGAALDLEICVRPQRRRPGEEVVGAS